MRHLKTKMTKIAVPMSLEMAIVKIRAELELDWEAACEHLAGLADPNGENFKKAVKREANRRYKSRHLSELNKAKKTFEDKGYDKGYSDGDVIGLRVGRALGLDQATREWRISYPCNVCGEPIHLKPERESTKAAVEFLSQSWGHSSCHEKPNTIALNPLPKSKVTP